MPTVIVKKSGIQGNGIFAAKSFRKAELVLQIDDSHVVVDEWFQKQYRDEIAALRTNG